MSSNEIPLVGPEARLKTSRLFLEPILPAHASRLNEQLQDERLYRFIPQDPATPQALDLGGARADLRRLRGLV